GVAYSGFDHRPRSGCAKTIQLHPVVPGRNCGLVRRRFRFTGRRSRTFLRRPLFMLIANTHGSELQTLQAESPEQIATIRDLFLEYAQSLGFSLCFQGFDQELAGLPGDYAPPPGRLLLAEFECQLVGCVALHKIDERICEMKRLYLRPGFRGKGVGRALAEALIAEARNI